jgi:hypothetical protein
VQRAQDCERFVHCFDALFEPFDFLLHIHFDA